jgi:hypothetical protein
MSLRLLVSLVLLSASILTACGETAPEAAPNAATAAEATEDAKAAEADIQRKVDQLSKNPVRLYAGEDALAAKISANGDFSIKDKTVAINDAQRAALVSYRERLVALGTAGIRLTANTTGVVLDKTGKLIGGVFMGEDPDKLKAELKAELQKVDVAGKQICTELPALLRAQNALAGILPEFKPYAHIAEADVAACDGTVTRTKESADKIGKMISAALGSAYSGGMVAGFMAGDAKHSDAKDAEGKTSAIENKSSAQ